jgi:hypothetical protein
MTSACTEARKHTSKYFAHLDLDHSIRRHKTPIARGQATNAVRAICQFVQRFHFAVLEVDHRLMPVGDNSDEQLFLLSLFQGNMAEKETVVARLAAAERGDWAAIDQLDPQKWIWRESEEERFFDI